MFFLKKGQAHPQRRHFFSNLAGYTSDNKIYYLVRNEVRISRDVMAYAA